MRALLGREPLYRRCDVTHLRSTLALTILALILVPLLVLAAVHVQIRSGETARSRELAHKHRVSAVLSIKPPTVARPGAETVAAGVRWVAADGTTHTGVATVAAGVRWVAADGTTHTGVAQVPPGGAAGDTAGIWLDAEGRPTTPPPSHGAIVVDGITAGMLVFALAFMVTAGAFGAEHLLTSRRRARAWEREWAVVEPNWTGRIEH
ncbi:Rv1733c family protein [Embleya sp. MST-111070]|uniref:Rv1733c family protein n=1 Tax=Embleya sp. MST-111070 TaxID=3398231 RepID=UPI003F738BFE